MGAIFSNNIITTGTLTVKSENPAYPKQNVFNLWNLKRNYIAADADGDASGYMMRIEFAGMHQVLEGLFLNDVNFDQVEVQGNDTGVWDAAGLTPVTAAISRDSVVNRYKVYIPLTGFNYKYLLLGIPGGTGITDGTGFWRIGTVCPLESVVTLTTNIAYGYDRAVEIPYADSKLSYGGTVRVALGDIPKWIGTIPFGGRRMAQDNETWSIGIFNPGLPLVFYENQGDTSRAYLCIKDDNYSARWSFYNFEEGGNVRFQELI